MKNIICLLFVIGILVWVPTTSADVYSWTDEHGVKHFGQQPPENAQNVKLEFTEEAHDAAADQQRTETENKALQEAIRDLDAEEQQQEKEKRQKAAQAAKNQQPSQEDRVATEKERLEAKIAELEEKPLSYFGSQKNKRVRIGYYRYRLEALLEDPDKYFSQPTRFEGNVKPVDQQNN